MKTYEILASPHIGTLQEKVLVALENGWEVQGGVACMIDPNYNETWAQAITLEQIPAPKKKRRKKKP